MVQKLPFELLTPGSVFFREESQKPQDQAPLPPAAGVLYAEVVRQTIYTIPHEVAGLPVFGLGWVLMLWAAVGVVALVWLLRRPRMPDHTQTA